LSDGPPAARRDLLLLLALGLVLLGSGLGLRNPWPPDEPRFSLVSREMLASGDLLFPRRGGELYADKPPVFLWIQAGWLAVTGSTRLANQIPSLLAALATLGLVADLGRRLWGGRAGLWCGLTLLAIVQFPLQARSGQIDATLTFFTTLGLYGLLRHLLLGPAWRWYALAGAAMGAGVLTKGVGFLPLFVLLPWAWARRRRWPGLPEIAGGWRWAMAPLLLLAVVAAWALPMALAASGSPELEAYRDDLLFRQTAVRYADSWTHREPVWYYLVQVVPGLWLPVTLLLPWLVPAWRRRLAQRDARLLLLLAWIVLVLTFFSLSSGKRGVYLLPAVPALAVVVGPVVPELARRRAVQRTAFGFTTLLAGALAVVAALASVGRLPTDLSALGGIGQIATPLAAAAALLAAVPLLAGPRRGLLALAGALAATWLVLGWWAYPLLDPFRSGSQLAARVEAALPPDAELAIVRWREQQLLYLDRPVTHFGFATPVGRQVDSAAAWARAVPGRYVLLPAELATRCFDVDLALDLGVAHRIRWLLVGGSDVRPGCEGRTVGPLVVSHNHRPLRRR
jgi:4-amino-4-deoxy-L-arabinose transferase-like glycosyltransferase